jgi:hypothetical protein
LIAEESAETDRDLDSEALERLTLAYEDVVSGRRTPKTEKEFAQSAPAVAAELRRCLVQLEKQFKDVQDVEFTIEDGRLWILQSRAAKRDGKGRAPDCRRSRAGGPNFRTEGPGASARDRSSGAFDCPVRR